jgi:MinD superfamily P-loop ATPase
MDVVVLGPDVREMPGALRFDPSDPAAILSSVAATASRSGRVVAVVGAGGGVGATTVALHLARAVATRRTCLLDLDTTWGLRDRLDLPDDALTWAEAEGEASRCALPVPGGFRVMLAPRGSCDANPEGLVSSARREFERLIVDAPVTTVSSVLGCCDAAVLVMAPGVSGARRARAVLNESPDVPWAVVVNAPGPGGETTRSEMQDILGRRITLELPCTPALRDAEGESTLLGWGWSRWERRVTRLGRVLLQ